MKQMKYVKAEDRVEAPADKSNEEAFDLKPLLGTWVNTNSATRGMGKVILTARGSNLNVRVFGLSDPSAGDWGEIKADSVYGNSLTSGQATAFTASYGFDFRHTDLMANLSQGLLILAAFNTFSDGSGRSNYFAREFFHRWNGDSNGGDRAMGSLARMGAEEQPTAEAPKPSAVEVGPLLGSWVNTNGGTRGITKVVFGIKEGKFVARLFGVCDPSPCDWGEVGAHPFARDAGSSELAGISLSYDFGFMETRMQAHVKQGVLVIAKFDHFRDDSGRSNSFSREFFYRPDA